MEIVQLGIRHHDVTNSPLWSRLSINTVMYMIIWIIKYISIDLFTLYHKAFDNANFCKAFQRCHSCKRRSQPLPDPDPLPERSIHILDDMAEMLIFLLQHVNLGHLPYHTDISLSCRSSTVLGFFTLVTVMKGNLHITHISNVTIPEPVWFIQLILG